jgi:hypothetical protein
MKITVNSNTQQRNLTPEKRERRPHTSPKDRRDYSITE